MSSQRTELRIGRLSKLGDGVASLEGRTVFVEGALPGEEVIADVSSDGKLLRGALVEVLKPSPFRREPACALSGACGGCDWLHIDESLQRDSKTEIILSALEHLGGISRDRFSLEPTIVAGPAMGYRRRAVMHWSGGSLGFFGKGSHQAIGIPTCPALVPKLQSLPERLSTTLGPMAKDVESLSMISEGDHVALALILKAAIKPRHPALVLAAMKAHGVRGVVLVPKTGTPEIFGRPVLRTECPLRPDVPLFLRPDAFAQISIEANAALATAALAALGPKETDDVLELYSGNGNFTFGIAGLSRSVLGVESSPIAFELAQRSAREGGVNNVRWIQGDVSKVCKGLVTEGRTFDLLLLDPPRTGTRGIGNWAQKLHVRKVVYVACDPAALARDAAELSVCGYRPTTLKLIDLFPQTRHIEAVMTFEAIH